MDSEYAYRSVNFPSLGEKWVLSSLAAFINDPLKVRPDGRMPRTAMEVADAADIAAYLLHYESSEGKAAPGCRGVLAGQDAGGTRAGPRRGGALWGVSSVAGGSGGAARGFERE